MPNIRHELLIGAPVEKVYDAITSAKGLSSWWTPGTTARPELNSIARFPFGPDYFKEMKIVALEPAALVKWTCIAGADEWIGTNISFKLTSQDKTSLSDFHDEVKDQAQQQDKFEKATLLSFHQDDWDAYTPMFAECNYTWAIFLRSLKLYCEIGKGTPWPNQHRVEA